MTTSVGVLLGDLGAGARDSLHQFNLQPAQLREAKRSAGVRTSSADAIDHRRLYREGKAAIMTRDVEQVLGRKPTSFTQFLTD
jgi:hypothetical protein